MTENNIIVILQRLTSKHLSYAEVIDASLPKGMPGHSSSLEPQIDRSTRLTIMVGSNPHFVARVLEADEKE